MTRLVPILAVLGLFASMAAEPCVAQHASEAIVLARMCAGESGPNALDTCAAETWLIVRRAERHGMRPSTMARAYSRALSPPPHRRWILTLRADGPAPSGWPSASWPRYRERFRRLLDVTTRVLAGDLADPCGDEEPLHFGGPMDAARFDSKAGWSRCCDDLDLHIPTRRRQLFWCPETNAPPSTGEAF